jgi:hypothetical protein
MSGAARLAANTAWYMLCLPESLAFRRACGDVAGAQEALLLRLLRRNAETVYGRRHGFDSIRSASEYQRRVPLTTYDDYRDAVRRMAVGEQRVLTRDPVLLWEPTSGSTAATKLVPYTASLKAEFQRAVAAWIVDLYAGDPGLLRGQAYWSVSPVARREARTSGGVPVGFEDDSEYFGALERRLINSLMAVPSLARLVDDMEAFRYVTLLFLLRSRALSLVSVWNPTFLTLLVEPLAALWPRLADEIERGGLSTPAPIEENVRFRLGAMNWPDPRRATEVREAFRVGGGPAGAHTRLWPHLRLISCWTDAHAALHARDLSGLFPQARVQGKGLLATEGVVSLPLLGREGAALAIRSHFLEFAPAGTSSGATLLRAHELEVGESYSVVLTTGGGLYRYRLYDLVEIVGRAGACPLVRFVGKEEHVSDWFGEKLDERHVRLALDEELARHNVRATFAMVACDEIRGDGDGLPSYILFVEAPSAADEILREVGAGLEARLGENYHYRYCRDLGQLRPLGVFRVAVGAEEAYLSACRQHGQRAGDVKPVALHRLGNWSRAFTGRVL